jgi:ATP-binding cassette subfamily B protein
VWHLGWRVDWGERNRPVRLEWPLLKRVFGYFVPYWKHALVVLACIGAGAACGLVPALVTKALIDQALKPGGSFALVGVLVSAAVVAVVLSGLVGVLQAFFSTLISQGIMFDLRNQLFERLLKQSVSFFTRSRTGDVMSRISNDVSGIQNVVSDTVFSLVQSLVIAVSTLAVMAALDWRLTLVALAILPAAVLPTRRVGQATYLARQRTQAKLADMTAYMQEVLGISGMLLVKAFVKERAERARFRTLSQELRRLEIRQAMIGRWFFMILRVLGDTGPGAAGPAVLWLFGGYLVLTGSLSLGTLVVFATVLLGRLYPQIAQMATLQVNVVGSLALFERLFDYLDMPEEIVEKSGARVLGNAAGAVAFENVTFAYTTRGRPALDGVSFDIEPGQLAALVGPTGAGKTTVTYLLPRFYDPQAGSIRVDGQDIRDVTLESLGRQIGMVFQDTFLFHTSIRENLLYARPESTDEELFRAARAANVHEFIQSLPDGYDTVVGERGHRLSGGEKKRIAIARVILKDPRILILDEATSNLDSESEHLIQAALKPLFAGRTSVVIAHRLSTILAADQILVLDRGRLVERGSHYELLESGGLYASLYHRQFQPAAAKAV